MIEYLTMNQMKRQILRAFEGKLVGNKRMKQFVVQTLALMPENVIHFVTRKVWFMASMEDAWGFAFRGNDLKNQYLIFLSDDLFTEPAKQIRHSIAHEIGHVVLKHRNSVFSVQSKTEIKRQEKEAEEFASRFT